jgi:hypothetical protein
VPYAGALYGTSQGDASDNYGTIYNIVPQSDGNWKFTKLDYFGNPYIAAPTGDVTFDASTEALYFT